MAGKPVHGDYRLSIVFDRDELVDFVSDPDLSVPVNELIP